MLAWLGSTARTDEAHGAGNGVVLTALAQAGLGAITLDHDGRALELNAAVVLGDGLDVAGGRPRASFTGDQAALDAAIRRALARAAPAAPGRLALRRPSGRRQLLVSALPLDKGARSPLPGALLAITDLDDGPPPAIGELQALFQLTRREADLAAALAGGARLDQAAARVGISVDHARQRLKQMFQKTQTRRQPELVALLARLRSLPPT